MVTASTGKALVLYDLEWDNGTSYIYTPWTQECSVLHFSVGVLRTNWLEGANYLGQQQIDGFLCHGWEKADFIGMVAHMMTLEVVPAKDENWQAPCFLCLLVDCLYEVQINLLIL
ncbi:uncharacterized protein At4g14100-like [Hevea brasiliensis]|uniref:uncharacterized protein At4g14100-like n=1 Tax=Hevea brasiliensis TaxID=3981 RepID=UPI0025DABAD6|nr:uncharacterized protein At4g14100-like [Hevea brasiliensis]